VVDTELDEPPPQAAQANNSAIIPMPTGSLNRISTPPRSVCMTHGKGKRFPRSRNPWSELLHIMEKCSLEPVLWGIGGGSIRETNALDCRGLVKAVKQLPGLGSVLNGPRLNSHHVSVFVAVHASHRR